MFAKDIFHFCRHNLCFNVVAFFPLPEPPTFQRTPRNATVVAGDDLLMECEASGDPTPKTRWTKLEPDGSELILDLPRYKVVLGEGLRFHHIHPDQAGFYKCIASSTVGTVSAQAYLQVNQAPDIKVRPPRQVVVAVEETVSIDCLVDGTPRPVVLWMQERDRTVLLPGDHTESGLGVTARGSLKISNAQISSSYVCMATNVVGSAMARSEIIVMASKQDVDQMELIRDERKNSLAVLDDFGMDTAKIESLSIFGLSSTSIKVSWTLATGKVDGFYILYRPKIGEPPGFTSITVLHAAATSYVVSRLTPHTPYEFLVVPFRRGLSGKPSSLYEAWTLEARPSHFPTELKWVQVNSSSVNIMWKPLSKLQFQGEPLGYQVSDILHLKVNIQKG